MRSTLRTAHRKPLTRARTALLSFALASWSFAALGQPLDKDADAERLFREAQKLMEERRYGEACPKFEAAYKKDQQLGTLLNLAYCHKEQGAIWQSWLEFKEAEVKAIELKRNDRKEFARQRMAELEKQLAKVVVESQQRVELTEVLVEDRRVPDGEKGQPFAVETGQRKFTFRAKGKKQAVQLVTVTKGSAPQRVTVPEMEEQPKEATPAPVDPTSEEPKPGPARPAGPKSDGSTQRTLGLVLIGAGVVGFGIGTVTGLITLNNECASGKCPKPPNNEPDPKQDVRDSGKTTGMIADLSFVAGGVLGLTGVLLFFLAPNPKAMAATPSVSKVGQVRVLPEIGLGWAGLRGAF